MTYLELVNAVMVKLREPTVATVSDTDYSRLVGVFVNETKREVEDAWTWNGLRETITITCVPGVSNYRLVGTNDRTTFRDGYNDSANFPMRAAASPWLNRQFLLAQPQGGRPQYWGLNGQDPVTRELFVDVYPVPISADILRLNVNLKPADMSTDSTRVRVPPHLIVLGAYARALEERGEDDTKARAAYTGALQTAIAADIENFPGETDWVVR